jgi:hypothetical protein
VIYRSNVILTKISMTVRPLVAHALILATQEAKIRRIMVQSQLGQIIQETLSQKKNHKKDW